MLYVYTIAFFSFWYDVFIYWCVRIE